MRSSFYCRSPFILFCDNPWVLYFDRDSTKIEPNVLYLYYLLKRSVPIIISQLISSSLKITVSLVHRCCHRSIVTRLSQTDQNCIVALDFWFCYPVFSPAFSCLLHSFLSKVLDVTYDVDHVRCHSWPWEVFLRTWKYTLQIGIVKYRFCTCTHVLLNSLIYSARSRVSNVYWIYAPI